MGTMNPIRLYEELSAALDEKAARVVARVIGELYEELGNQVTKEEFRELTRVVGELAETVGELAGRVTELAEAQQHTESRLEQLAEAQQHTESRLERLAEAQQRTEARLEQLASAQQRTEARLEQLASAQQRTERELAHLSRTVGGLSVDLGHLVEDSIFPYIIDFARREYGLEVSVLDRRNIEYPDGRFDEIDVYAEGSEGGSRAVLIAEVKSQPGKRDIDRFAEVVHRVQAHTGTTVHPVLIASTADPRVERYLREHHAEIRFVPRYAFELRSERRRPA